jgi:two-component system sensor histidine kinase PrrB
VRNLRGRLTIGVLTVLTTVLSIGGVIVARDVERSERQVIDDRLRRTAELSDVTAVATIQSGLQEPDARLNAVLRATGSSLRVTLGDAVILQSGVPIPLTGRAPLGFSTRTIGGQRVRVFTKTLEIDSLGGLARIDASTSLRQLEARIDRRRERIVAIVLAMIVLAGVGVWLAADLVLRPLRRLRRATGAIAVDEDLERRVPVEGPAELRALAGSFNDMLVRLGRSAADRTRALDATRRFAADAGHELRTPLTSVQATLSIIARHPELEDEQRKQLAEDALVDSAAQNLRARHPDLTVDTELPPGSVIVRGWEPGLRVLVENLTANAGRHGRRGGRVRVTLRPADRTTSPPAGPVLVVEDDGPGVPEEERERIFAPFVRATETDRPGSGLGLALVAQQAGHHDAAVTVDSSPELGGARFEVRFPAGRG